MLINSNNIWEIITAFATCFAAFGTSAAAMMAYRSSEVAVRLAREGRELQQKENYERACFQVIYILPRFLLAHELLTEVKQNFEPDRLDEYKNSIIKANLNLGPETLHSLTSIRNNLAVKVASADAYMKTLVEAINYADENGREIEIDEFYGSVVHILRNLDEVIPALEEVTRFVEKNSYH